MKDNRKPQFNTPCSKLSYKIFYPGAHKTMRRNKFMQFFTLELSYGAPRTQWCSCERHAPFCEDDLQQKINISMTHSFFPQMTCSRICCFVLLSFQINRSLYCLLHTATLNIKITCYRARIDTVRRIHTYVSFQ